MERHSGPGAKRGAPKRHHEPQFKRRLVELSLKPDASVSAIALEHGINANLLFKWRRDRLRAEAPKEVAPVLLPIQLAPTLPEQAVKPVPTRPEAQVAGSIELEVAGARIRLEGAVDEGNLRSVLKALRRRT